MFDERRVFNENMCFICHLTVEDVKLKHCSSCKLVLYCSESHQKKHWKNHKDFCKVIQKIERTFTPVNLENNQDWFKYRINLLMLCEVNLGRKLKQYETKMILFPTNCQICHKRTSLKACTNCLCVSYCSDEHKNADLGFHSSICHLYSLCLKTDLYEEKTTYYPRCNVRQGDIKLSDDISIFISSNIISKRNSKCNEIEEALLSEFLTGPLSMLYALSRLSYCFPEHTVIHIVGCSRLEAISVPYWDIILGIHKNIKNLRVHFIGPDVKKLKGLDHFYGGQVGLKFSKKLYHDFIKSTKYEKPDLICAFNCGFHEFEGTPMDTWKQSLPFLIENRSSPFIFTSFTEEEAERDLKKLKEVEPNLDASIVLNPFSSLRPYREPENLGVFFSNNYLGIVKPAG